MKILLRLSFVLLFITSFGCDNDSSDVECFTPPSGFAFQFIDKDSGENLFTNGTYDSKQAITVVDLSNNQIIQTKYMKAEELNILAIGTIGWKTEKVSYSINFQGKSIFELHVDVERISGECSYTKFNSVEIKNAEFKIDQATGITKILINTKI